MQTLQQLSQRGVSRGIAHVHLSPSRRAGGGSALVPLIPCLHHNGSRHANGQGFRGPSERRAMQQGATVQHHDVEAFETWDVLGIGQAAVDYAAHLPDDDALHVCTVPKGGRRVITPEERAEVMSYLADNFETQVSAGGSLANTLVGLSRLGAAPSAPKHLRVAMAGCVVGSDALGAFARAQLHQAGVEVLLTGDTISASTGTVMVLQTPDAQRSFLSCFPADCRLELTPSLTAAVARSKLLVLEGYLWELPGSETVVPAIVSLARSVGTLVALTAGDAGVVERHGDKVLAALAAGVDVFFCNAAEAEALLNRLPQQQQQQQQSSAAADPACSTTTDAADAAPSLPPAQQQQQQQPAACDDLNATISPAQQAALQLAGICPTVVVTDGSKGSYVTAMGELLIVPPHWSPRPPIDTTGAGDGYAAGFLYAYLSGVDLHSMGHFASRTASAVISRYGPQLSHDDAGEVVASQQLTSWRSWLRQQGAQELLGQQAAAVPQQAQQLPTPIQQQQQQT